MSEQRSLARATIGALGVVYGDIGTSPLYALKEATAAAGGATDAATVLGVLGVIAIAREPRVLEALFPGFGLELLAAHPSLALGILGAVFLVVTGGEALYADMGHFGKTPVRLAWFTLVWPGLLLSYFGQG